MFKYSYAAMPLVGIKSLEFAKAENLLHEQIHGLKNTSMQSGCHECCNAERWTLNYH